MRAEKAEQAAFSLLITDSHIQAIQKSLNADLIKLRKKRAYVARKLPQSKIIREQGSVYFLYGHEAILIRQTIEKYNLDNDFITVSERDHNLDLHGFQVDLSPRKPVVAASDNELTRYVRRTHPIPRYATPEEIESTKIERRVLSRTLKSARKKGIATILTALYAIGGKTGNERATKTQLKRQEKSNKDNNLWLENSEIHGQNGEVYNLAESGTTAEKRIAELTAISKGIQEYCGDTLGQVWAFIVVKLPSQFHPNPTKGKNSWNGIMPSESANVLNKKFREVQDILNKKKVHITGLKTIETHKDGCPHINFFIYFDHQNQKVVEQTFKKVYGRSKNLCCFTLGKSGQDSAKYATYITKYIKKHLGTGNEGDKTTLAEQACKSAWKWRSFETFGIPTLGCWRILRTSCIKPEDYDTACLWQSARNGNFYSYIELMGGININDKKRNFKVVKEKSKSGKSDVVIGVLNKNTEAETIIKEVGFWRVEQKPQQPNVINFKWHLFADSGNAYFFTIQTFSTRKLTKLKFKKMVKGVGFKKSKFPPQLTTPIVGSGSIFMTNTAKTMSINALKETLKTNVKAGFESNLINESSTLILNSASKVKIENQNLEKQKFDDSRLIKPPLIPIERLKNNTEQVSNRQAAVADIVKRRSVHPGYRYRISMINADLAALGLSPLTIFDNVH